MHYLVLFSFFGSSVSNVIYTFYPNELDASFFMALSSEIDNIALKVQFLHSFLFLSVLFGFFALNCPAS